MGGSLGPGPGAGRFTQQLDLAQGNPRVHLVGADDLPGALDGIDDGQALSRRPGAHPI